MFFAAVYFFSFLFFVQREISAVSQPITAKLCYMIGNGCNFKKGPKFGGPPPKNWGPKNMRLLQHGARSDEYLCTGGAYRRHMVE